MPKDGQKKAKGRLKEGRRNAKRRPWKAKEMLKEGQRKSKELRKV
jgi:hypothetical protein